MEYTLRFKNTAKTTLPVISAIHALDVSFGEPVLNGRIPDLRIALEPGEEIQGPSVLIGLYKGDSNDGTNRLRRLIRERYTPKLGGGTHVPATLYSNWYDLWGFFDETQLRKTIDAAAALDQEYFLLDAGWYAGAGKQDGGFYAGLGNWEEIDNQKLPNGLKPIADYVRSKGMQFGLWFEPERVADGSRLAKAHPEWVLWAHEQEPASWLQDTTPNHPYWKQRLGLLDFGRQDVQEWVRNMMDRYIKDHGIKYVRHDFNIDPLPYWEANDRDDRRGITQIRYVKGLHAVMDWLRERNPDTIFEGCASGGLRIDLEMARRYHAFWISDNHVDTAISRFHLHGINQFLPGNYNVVTYILPLAHRRAQAEGGRQLQFQADDLGLQSLFGGAFGMGGKSLRRYLLEDYYPLSAQPGDLTSWSGWQFHDPVDESGFAQTFRTRTSDEDHRFVLHGLDPQARYRFTEAYDGRSFEIQGAAAMREGIEVKQQSMSSRILLYRKIGRR